MMYTSHDGKTFSSYKSLCQHEMMFGPNKDYWTAEYNKCKERDDRIVRAVGGQDNATAIGKVILTILLGFVAIGFVLMLVGEV